MINRHLIVGLGGNGGKIIRELKKTLKQNEEERGDSNITFEYLYVDTSDDELSKRDEWKVLGQDISLANSQWLINPASSVQPVLADPKSYPGLAPWIEPWEVFSFVSASTAGAAQKRKLGRLVFAQNARKFDDAIVQRVGELQTRAGRNGAAIHIVCGLAGGTGSGSIVDAVALIRQRYPSAREYPILIYAIMPELNASPAKVKSAGGFANYYANAYAALAELNAIAVGGYSPVNVLDGKRMKHDIYFDGCYLVHNVNENGVQFQPDHEVPRIVAEFIYQKTVNSEWEDLGRAEKGENEVKNFENDGSLKARAKLFLSFGIERVVVPEAEIREFMAYSFAEQATRQLIFNNFRQGEGFAEEPFQKDWRSEVRKPDVMQALLLTDPHLMLESGVLEDDQKNALWKPAREFWKTMVARVAPEIQADKGLEQTAWISTLQVKLAKIFDETYRSLGGVVKFYEMKAKARPEMARHIALHVEKDLFARWKSGQWSLIQLRQFIDATIEMLDERLAFMNDQIAKAPTELQQQNKRLRELAERFNNVGMFGKLLTDKRESTFAEIAAIQQEVLVLRTTVEGMKFAGNFIPLVKEQLWQLRNAIDALQLKLAAATEKVNAARAAQLGPSDSAYQKRFFDRPAIDRLMRSMITDEQGQQARTQKVRAAIIELAGKDVASFDKLNDSASTDSLITTLSQQSAEIIELTHGELAKTLTPVLHVNIIDRLAAKFDANEGALKEFVRSMYADAGCMLRFDEGEMARSVEGNVGGSSGRLQFIGVFLPECDTNKAFHDRLEELFRQHRPPTGQTRIQAGRFSNQIVVMKVSSLMPARFVDGLKDLKHHYDGLSRDRMEAALLHSEGDGQKLPALYAKTAAEIEEGQMHRPTLVAARLLNIVRLRQNKTTGLNEWVLIQMVDDLPATTVLGGQPWFDLLRIDMPDGVRQALRTAVSQKIAKDYKHVDRKQELDAAFKQMMRDRFAAAGDTDQDEEYQALMDMRQLFLQRVVGLQ
jgi:hypothetical protein